MSEAALVKQNESAAPRVQIEELKSWLPVDAIVHEGFPQIEWLDMTGVSLSEPFFQQTVARVKREKGLAPLRTDLEDLIRLEKVSDSLCPSGFIFHSSRCGSTLLANACRALKGALVVAEAPVVDKLISRFFTDTEAGSAKALLYSVLVRAAVNALGQRRLGQENYYFVKFTATSILQFDRLRKIWPNVPAVFLYRDPTEVIVSNLQNIPDWMIVESNPKTSAAIVGVVEDELPSLSAEEFCARALARFYTAATAIGSRNIFLCNYDNLSAHTMLQLVKYFGVPVSVEEAEAIKNVTQRYSKDPSRTFASDSELKRATASETARNLAERWPMPAYRQLVQMEMDQNAASIV